MDYTETLDYLYAKLPMYHRIGPAAYKPDLKNTLELCKSIGNPHRKFHTIHVAGTNGKGSVSHMLAAILQSAGLKTGLYISPHYKDFRERIKVNGKLIGKNKVVHFIEKHRASIEKIEPSFFELCVAMAFDHFAKEKVDIAIIEVGLGGRLDSTNIITPRVSVITNISFDHQAMLGDTLPLIAGEKAGIIKPKTPVVIGESHPETRPVFLKKAFSTESEIQFADEKFVIKPIVSDWQSTTYDVFEKKSGQHSTIKLDAAGPFQEKNLATVLTTIDVFSKTSFGKKIGEVMLKKATEIGLANLRELTKFQGRWQILGQNPTILADSAHNEAGLQIAFSEIKKHDFENLHIVTGFVNDKEVDKILGLFPQNARYYFAKADIPRGLDAAILRDKSAIFGLKGKVHTSVKNALAAAQRTAAPTDLILVIGSIFVVAEVL